METEAYVLVRLGRADETKVLKRIQKIEAVVEAHVLFGEWDLLVKLKGQNPSEVGTFVMDHIRSLASVRLTSTLIVAK